MHVSIAVGNSSMQLRGHVTGWLQKVKKDNSVTRDNVLSNSTNITDIALNPSHLPDSSSVIAYFVKLEFSV